jgi:hypothetical protein
LFHTCKPCKLRQNITSGLPRRCFSPGRSSKTATSAAPSFLTPCSPLRCTHPYPTHEFIHLVFSSSHAMTHQAGPARAFTQSRPLSQTHHAMVAPRSSLHVPPLHLRSRLRVHGSQQFILSGPRAGEPARSPSAVPMRTTLPCSTDHLPLQTARAHGPHFQMGSLRPR